MRFEREKPASSLREPGHYRTAGLAEPLKLETDTIVRVGLQIEIRSPYPMDELTTRRHLHRPIAFEGTLYRVTDQRVAPSLHIYTLTSWPEGSFSTVPPLVFDEAFVQARNRRLRLERVSPLLEVFAYLALPFLGLLPSRWLEPLEGYGISGVRCVRASLPLVAIAALVLFVALITSGHFGLSMVLPSLLMTDVVARSALLRREKPSGVFGWVFHLLRRRTS